MESVDSFILQCRRVIRPDGFGPAAIVVESGVIRAVEQHKPQSRHNSNLIDVGDLVVMPGLVDTHVHINEPGRTDWEGLATATQAAAAGGITTLVDMPLNSSPVTTTARAMREKLDAAQGRCLVDFGFWGGLVPGNVNELESLLEAGALGVKCFLVHSGIDEFPNVSERDLRKAMPILARRNAVLLVHAESPEVIDTATRSLALGDSPGPYSTYLKSRPQRAEVQAIEMMIRLCEEFNCPVHIVHLSAAEALPAIAAARARNLPLTVETCPHYLAFCAEEIPDGSTIHKCAPPIRERANNEQLWKALRDGLIDMVVSDHSPCPPAMKHQDTGDLFAAWGGIASLQFGLPIVWTHMKQRGIDMARLVEWMCTRPAQLAGLSGDGPPRKGLIAPGYDADFVIWNPEQSFTVNESMIHHRHKLTPYAGMTLQGVVQSTIVSGRIVYDRGSFATDRAGRWIRRGHP